MSAPDSIGVDYLAQGESYKPRFKVRNRTTNAVVDLTVSGVTLSYRLALNGSVVTTRTSGQSGEYSYATDGTDGDVTFLFAPATTAAFSAGTYTVELVYTGTAPTPDDKIVLARGTLVVAPPTTGTI